MRSGWGGDKMRDLVFDFAMRMTGGDRAVAALCAQTVGGVETGDVCRPLDESETALLEKVPEAVSFVTDDAAPDDVRTPFVVAHGLLYTRRNWYYERLVRDRLAEMCRPMAWDEASLADFSPYCEGLLDEQRRALHSVYRDDAGGVRPGREPLDERG